MRRKHGEKECPEPWVEWEWMRFPDHSKESTEIELIAEAESDGDLRKSIPQLVCEFNLEIPKLGSGKYEERILLTAQSRMVAMMAKVAISNNRMGWAMIVLTGFIFLLTLMLFLKG